MRWIFLCVPLTATLLMCAKSSSSVDVLRFVAPTYSKKSLLTSCEVAALNSIRIMFASIMPVMVLYLLQMFLNSCYSRSSMSVLLVGRSGDFVFGLCDVVLGLVFEDS